MQGLKKIAVNPTVKNTAQKIVATALMAVFALPAMATDQYNDRGRVISTVAQTERVNMPRQECRTEYQQQSYSNGGNNSIMGAVIGGIAGGLLGNTIGRGNGRVAAAAVGAGVGAVAGNSIGSNNNGGGSRMAPVQSCYQVDSWQTVNAGYLVTYEYNGRTYTTVTNNQPGQYIDLSVAVTPVNSPQVVSQNNYVEYAGYDNGYREHHHDRGEHRGWGGGDREGRYY